MAADHLGRSGKRGTLPFQPLVHVIEQRLAFLVPHSQSFCGAQAIDLTLDFKQRVEPLDGLQRDRGDRPAVSFAIPSPFLDIGQFKEFPSRMRVAKSKSDRHRFLFGNTDRLEATVTVTLQNAAIPGQVFLRMLAAAVTRSIIDRCRSRAAPEGLVIAHVAPDAPGRAFAFGPDGNGRIVTMKALGRKDMLLDQIEDRHERGGSKPDLIGQRRGRQRDAFACEPGALAIERTVHAELVEQDRRQQMRADEAARRGMERRRRLADRLTVPAAVLLPDRLDHFEPTRDLLQRLGDVLAQFRQARATAAGTGSRRINHHAFALDILRPGLSDRPPAHKRAPV